MILENLLARTVDIWERELVDDVFLGEGAVRHCEWGTGGRQCGWGH